VGGDGRWEGGTTKEMEEGDGGREFLPCTED